MALVVQPGEKARMEIEAKFELHDRGILGRLERAEKLAGFDLGEKRVSQVVDTYFDTKRRLLWAAGYYLRVRRQGEDHALITVKQYAGDGQPVFRREEHELTLPVESGDGPPVDVSAWPESPARDLVERIAARKPLAPLLRLRQHRTVRPLLRDGKTVADLSLDDVQVRHGESTTVFSAIEVELKGDGDEAVLDAVVARLREEPGLSPEPTSKFERALALIEEPAAALTPEPEAGSTGVDLDDSMAEAARKTLLSQLGQMKEHEAGTRAGEDAEELHDMRVATRRMRAALEVFEPYLSAAYRPYARSLRRVGRALGTVRDLDVFRENARAYLDSLPAERRGDLDPLLVAWRVEYDRRRGELLSVLDGDGYSHFKRAFGDFLQRPAADLQLTLSDNGVPRPRRARQLLPAMLFRQYAQAWAFDGWVNGPDVPFGRYHQLRIALKSLRYTLEFFREVLPPDAEDLINRTKQIQDHLGSMQDAVVACEILRDFLLSGTWGPASRHRPEALPLVVAPGVATYLSHRQAGLEALIDSFPQVWTRVVGPEAGRGLGAITAALVR